MGCNISLETSHEDSSQSARRRNNDIEAQLLLGHNQSRNEFKILLLGTGESGKSTVLKQMRLIHSQNFDAKERKKYAMVVWADAIQSMKILISQCYILGIPLDSDRDTSENGCNMMLRANPRELTDHQIDDYVLKYDTTPVRARRLYGSYEDDRIYESVVYGNKDLLADSVETPPIPQYSKHAGFKLAYRKEVANAISLLWLHDKGIQRCLARSNEFQLEASAEYYFDNISKFADEAYLATDLDILKGRIKTTGITETLFKTGHLTFRMVDVGGQRSERRKWIHCFEDVTTILFVVALSEYDQVLFEDETMNRMQEALVLFEEICKSRWFQRTSIILFLNKTDIFRQKIQFNPIRNYFPEYQGVQDDFESGCQFFMKLFLQRNRQVYVHFTCATNTKNMTFVMAAVTDMIIQQNLKQSGLM
ncbi:guanine nucleotide binding protein, alpha subunit [Nadsonia fulvescens var. elongata DSM 6958]|uniref:Guanine nucleotide binding protein, alpha subunit n=1 Tax=Nadsonia fulvescens var. elongata DSM 6958 TaxID=857566 RepID=A0A1E3PIQ5_9ASCO|nr:guanine nucleotide binding protein, alpha subunit [Nadsonia fulvescens var. elongata DSM 6958]